MSAILNTYSYYLAPYVGKSAPGRRSGDSRYDSHKESELKAVYNRMIKYNKENPLYMYKQSGSIANFAIGIKESAHSLKKTISKISDTISLDDGFYSKKTAKSSDENVVSVNYLGNDLPSDNDISEFTIQVNSLASPQVNLGHFLSDERSNMQPGEYSLDVAMENMNYEFQFSVRESDTNRGIQERIARMINKAGIGIDAEVISDNTDKSAIKLESAQTGTQERGNYVFIIEDSILSDKKSISATNYLGLDNVIQEPADSDFLLNGTQHSSKSNTFTVNNEFELTLRDSSDEPVKIGFKNDVDSVTDNISYLIDAYNDVIGTANRFSSQQAGTTKLLHDIGAAAAMYENSLNSIGLSITDEGEIAMDKTKVSALAAEDHGMKFICSTLKTFKNSMENEADSLMMDPMRYAQKTLVAYKNPGREFATPYVTSIYSGMIFNGYC